MKRSLCAGVVCLLVAGFSVAPFWSAEAADKFAAVRLTYVGGEECVKLDKKRVKVFRNQRPKRVRWQVSSTGHYWEIRYQESGATDPDKGEGMGDFFANSGDLDIACGKTRIGTEVPTVLAPANATWPYMIKVYACEDGEKAEFLCELDPNVDWGDG